MKTYDSFNAWYRDQSSSQKQIITKLRKLVAETAPSLTETSKWTNGVWLKGDLPLLFIHTEPDHVQFGFFAGALLTDPKKILRGKGKFVRHIRVESSKDIDAPAFVTMIRKAVKAPSYRKTATQKENPGIKPKRNACGNPIIPKGEGSKVVGSYIAAMPGWKKDLGEKLNKIIVKCIPDVEMQVKWNTPFYGFKSTGWIITLYCYKDYVQVGFLNGDKLTPKPPKTSKQKGVRYWNIGEGDYDEKKFKKWVMQAKRFPGEVI